MTKTTSRDSSIDAGAGEARFDPFNYVLRTRMDQEGGLQVCSGPEDFVRSYTAELYGLPEDDAGDFEPDEKHRVASVEFQVIGLATYEDRGCGSAFMCLDDLSQDLCDVGEALLDPGDDEEGEHPREELGLALPGGDLLYIEMIEVAPSLRSEQVFEVVRYLLENLLVRFGYGCFAAVYCQANWESIGLARPLKDRGFNQVPEKRNIWFADLGRVRPPLVTESELPPGQRRS